MTYGINLNVLQASVIWNICNAENKMISVERVLQYTKLTSEAPQIVDDCRPPNNWPTTGTISFQNLQVSGCRLIKWLKSEYSLIHINLHGFLPECSKIHGNLSTCFLLLIFSLSFFSDFIPTVFSYFFPFLNTSKNLTHIIII